MPDPALVTETYDKDQRIVAMQGDAYTLVYSAEGKQIALGAVDRKIPPVFTPPSRGRSSNWILVLDAAAQKFAPIGGGR